MPVQPKRSISTVPPSTERLWPDRKGPQDCQDDGAAAAAAGARGGLGLRCAGEEAELPHSLPGRCAQAVTGLLPAQPRAGAWTALARLQPRHCP